MGMDVQIFVCLFTLLLFNFHYTAYRFPIPHGHGVDYCHSEVKRYHIQNSINNNQKDCIQAAEEILSRMDETVDPCEDFYEFACGRFIRNTTVPNDQLEVSMLSRLRNIIKEQVRQSFQGVFTKRKIDLRLEMFYNPK